MGLLLPKTFVARQQFEARRKRQQLAHEIKRRTTNLIQETYPEHLFTVEVDPDNGNILIDHPLLKHAGARYFLPFDKWDHGRGAVKMAGEILERANVRRGELKFFEEYDEAESLAKTQFQAR